MKRINEEKTARLFMDHFLPKMSSDTLLQNYETFLQKNQNDNKLSSLSGQSILDKLDDVITMKKEIIRALDKREELYQKREIIWNQWINQKTLKFCEDADLLEDQLQQMDKIILKTNENLYSEINDYYEKFTEHFKQWGEYFVSSKYN